MKHANKNSDTLQSNVILFRPTYPLQKAIREAIQVWSNTEAHSRNHCCWGKAKYYIFWVCVWSLSSPACKVHAPYYIAICGLSCLYHGFPHYLRNSTIFRKKLLTIISVLIFSTPLSHIFHILRRIQWDAIINIHTFVYLLFLSNFNKTWIFSTDFQKMLI
jgi:hypothetical protein